MALVTQIYLDLPPLVWDMIAFTWNQQMAPQSISIWGVALEAGDFKLIIEWNHERKMKNNSAFNLIYIVKIVYLENIFKIILPICVRPERVWPKLSSIQGIRANLVYLVSLHIFRALMHSWIKSGTLQGFTNLGNSIVGLQWMLVPG